MTTRRALIAVFAASMALATACAGETPGKRGGLNDAQLAQLPPNVHEAYDVFAYKCSRCHTLARPLNAAITDFSHWEAYVARMRRHAGSGISQADADKILVFLRYYAEQKAEAEAKRRGEPAKPAEKPPEKPPAEAPPQNQGARP